MCSRLRPSCRARLFCFPYAGVGPSAYRGWADEIDAAEVRLVHPPGRESRFREPAISSIPLLARSIAEDISTLLDRPYVFFGHSFGCLVAFETARFLRDNGSPLPELMIVSSSRAPHLPWPHPHVAHLPDLELLQEVHRRYASIPAAVLESQELQQLLTPSLRSDLDSLEQYRFVPSNPFLFPIHAYDGRKDTMVSADSIDAWDKHTASTFVRKTFDGGHFYLQSARSELISTVSTELDKICETTDGQGYAQALGHPSSSFDGGR